MTRLVRRGPVWLLEDLNSIKASSGITNVNNVMGRESTISGV